MELKQGKQAVIINARCKENIGKTVTLVEHSTEERVTLPNNITSLTPKAGCRDNWIVEGNSLTMVWVNSEFGSDIHTRMPYGYLPASYLIPIGDDPDKHEKVENIEIFENIGAPV